MARARTRPGLSPLNLVTLVFIVPFAFILCLLGVSHDIARKPQRGGPVVLWKLAEPCHADDWLCWLQHEPNTKG